METVLGSELKEMVSVTMSAVVVELSSRGGTMDRYDVTVIAKCACRRESLARIGANRVSNNKRRKLHRMFDIATQFASGFRVSPEDYQSLVKAGAVAVSKACFHSRSVPWLYDTKTKTIQLKETNPRIRRRGEIVESALRHLCEVECVTDAEIQEIVGGSPNLWVLKKRGFVSAIPPSSSVWRATGLMACVRRHGIYLALAERVLVPGETYTRASLARLAPEVRQVSAFIKWAVRAGLLEAASKRRLAAFAITDAGRKYLEDIESKLKGITGAARGARARA